MEKATVFSPSLLEYVIRCHVRMMSRACGMFVRCCGFVEKIKKKSMEKNCCNSQCFQGKNYKTKFLTILIFKK